MQVQVSNERRERALSVADRPDPDLLGDPERSGSRYAESRANGGNGYYLGLRSLVDCELAMLQELTTWTDNGQDGSAQQQGTNADYAMVPL